MPLLVVRNYRNKCVMALGITKSLSSQDNGDFWKCMNLRTLQAVGRTELQAKKSFHSEHKSNNKTTLPNNSQITRVTLKI